MHSFFQRMIATSFGLSLLLSMHAARAAAAPQAPQQAAPQPTLPAIGQDLIPVPADAKWGEGRLILDEKFTVGVTGVKDARVQQAAERFIKRLEKRTGIHFIAQTPSGDKAMLVLDCKKAGLPVQTVRESEAYVLTVSDKQAEISGDNALGVLRGLETLLQLVGSENGKHFVPSVTIHDQPRFAWRGLLIDVSRHFEPVEVIKRNLDGLAEAKLNVLHWHLSDDQGFRVESKKLPKLQGMGSDGNFYTQDQIKDVLAYARARGIRVVPEFDMPGHCSSWLAGYPELSPAPGPVGPSGLKGPYAVEHRPGTFDATLDPTRDAVYDFLDTFIGEMAGLFQDEYFHIGGDEVTPRQWMESPTTQAFMNQHGMKTIAELHEYFNGRLSKIVSKHGKKMVGWDEIMSANLPKNVVIHSWRGPEGLANAAKSGFDVILSNGYYLDLIKPASIHYANDPLPASNALNAEAKAHVLGGEACMWGEFVSPETIDSRIWPRLLAVAERLWSPQSVQDVESLYRRMDVEGARLEELGLTHRSNYKPMLERMVGKEGVEPMQVLADVVTPIKGYGRDKWHEYSTLEPLNRLIDAARPESETARRFQQAVDAWIATGPKFAKDDALRAQLTTWKSNHAKLGKFLEKSPIAMEAYLQSQDLSESARLGVEALDYLKSGKQAPAAWSAKADPIFNRAQIARGDVDIAVLPAIRKLAIAAAQSDSLNALPLAERANALKSKVEEVSLKADEDGTSL